MGMIIAIGVIYIGGPLGVLLILIGVIGMLRRKTNSDVPANEYGWPGLLLVLGIILSLIAGLMLLDLANVNFGL